MKREKEMDMMLKNIEGRDEREYVRERDRER